MARGNTGFIKIPRTLLDDFAKERHKFSKAEAYLYLSQNAHYATEEKMVGNVPCRKGQVATSLRELAKAFAWPEAAVRRFLLSLVELDYIIWTSYKRTTLITVKCLSDEAVINAELSKGDATCDATTDATFDATFDANNNQEIKELGVSGDATCDATCDATTDATSDAIARVLYYNSKKDKEYKEPPYPQRGKNEFSKFGCFDFSFVEEPFKDAFLKWLDYKLGRREKYKTQRSLQQCYDNMKKNCGKDPSAAMDMVDFSIGNNYAGLFPARRDHNSQSPKEPTIQDRHTAFVRWLGGKVNNDENAIIAFHVSLDDFMAMLRACGNDAKKMAAIVEEVIRRPITYEEGLIGAFRKHMGGKVC